MAQDRGGPASRGLAQVCRRASIVIGGIAFLCTLAPLLRDARMPFMAAIVWLVLLVTWSLAFTLRRATLRSVVQVLVLLVMAAIPVAVPSVNSLAWLPVPLLALCASATAALTLTLPWGLAATAVSFVLALVFTDESPARFLTAVGQQAPWLALPYIVSIGGGLAVSRHYAGLLTRRADAMAQQTDEATELGRRAERAAQARAAVDRRIHETVLNTLAAIANGGASAEQLRRECRRDLEQMQLGFMPQADPGLAAVVRSAMQVAGTLQAVLSVDVLRDVELDRGAAGALRDAIVECLRNVERHAGATAVQVTVDADETHATVTVADDGIGMPDDVQERFGVRNSIRAALGALGGSATVESEPGRGTSVRLVVPIRVRPPDLPPPLAVPRAERFIGRLGLLGPVLGTVVALPVASAGMPDRGLLLGTMLAFTLLCVALAWPFAPRVLRALAWAAVGLGVVLTLVTGSTISGCSANPVVASVVVAVIGSLFLLPIDLGPRIGQRLAGLLVLLVASGALVLRLPAGCRVGTILIAIIMTLFVIGLLVITTATLAGLAEQEQARRRAEEDRRESDAQIAEVLASRAAWSKVTGTTREVLASIAEGTVDPSDAFVRDRARLEEAQLRARLDQQDARGLRQAVIDAVAEAARTVDVTTVGAGDERRTAPPSVRALIMGLLAEAPNGSVSARVMFIDGQEEVLVTAPRALLDRHRSGFDDTVVLAEPIPGSDGESGQLILRWRSPD